jgi:hypothetical protein
MLAAVAKAAKGDEYQVLLLAPVLLAVSLPLVGSVE